MPASVIENWHSVDAGKRSFDMMKDIKLCVVKAASKIEWMWVAFKDYSSAVELGVKSHLCLRSFFPLGVLHVFDMFTPRVIPNYMSTRIL